jgi:hypothetical protein
MRVNQRRRKQCCCPQAATAALTRAWLSTVWKLVADMKLTRMELCQQVDGPILIVAAADLELNRPLKMLFRQSKKRRHGHDDFVDWPWMG